jgi:ribosome-associated toxin RatA of RatAB toxin-antitoxin module
MLVLVAVLAGGGRVAEGRPYLDDRHLGQLVRYDVLLLSDPDGAGLLRHRAIGMFDAPPKEVFQVATSYDQYREYIPRIDSHVMSRKDNEALVRVEADLPWPMPNVWVDARYCQDAPSTEVYRVRFDMVRGNMRRYEGSLLIEPFGPGKATVTYELLAEPNSHLPRAWVQRALGRTALSFVNYLRSRVNNLQRQAARRQAAQRQAPAPAKVPVP